jgi:DNA-binding NarL/FixJ family response regulator/predicted DNA-binding transcriptional regulator
MWRTMASMDPALLSLLGIDPATENIYRLLLSTAGMDAAAVSSAFEIDVASARASLDGLHQLGLVNLSATSGEYVAVDPRHSLRIVADRHAAQLNKIRDTLGPLGEIFDDARRAHASTTQTRVLSGPQEVGDFYYRMKHAAARDFVAFDRPPYIVSSSPPLEESIIRRGVRVRAIYSASSFDPEGSWDRVRSLVAAGEDARVMPELPVKLAIADKSIAMISSNLSFDHPEMLVTEAPPLVEALGLLFESHWGAAAPIAASGDSTSPTAVPWEEVALRLAEASSGQLAVVTAPHRRPTAEERDLLTLLAGGLKDETIARQLGVSTRTLNRRIQDVFAELGATNRFRAGVAASKRGWL